MGVFMAVDRVDDAAGEGKGRSLAAQGPDARRALARSSGQRELGFAGAQRGNRDVAAARRTDRPSKSVLETVWDARWTVVCVVALFVVGAAAYVVRATPIYSSTARILVEREGPAIINSDNEQAVSSSKNYLQTQCSMLKSTPIAAAAIEAVDVGSFKTFDGVKDPVAYLKSNLLAELGLKDDLIACTLEAPYPDEASALVNGVVAAYVRFQSAQRRSTASDVLKVLQGEKREREADLKQKSQTLTAFKQANGMLSFTDDKGNIITQRLGRLSDEITDAQLQTIRAAADHKAALAALSGDAARRTEWLQALQAKGELRDTDAMYQRLRDSVVGLEVRLATSPNAKNHPIVQGARQMLDQVTAKMNEEEQKMAQGYLAMSARKLEMAQNNEAAIQARYGEQERMAQDLNSRMAENAALDAAVRQAERYNELLDSRINELMTIQQAPAMNIRVLENAEASKSPVRPAGARVLAAALALGLFCGSGLALLRSRLEQRMMSLPEIVALLDLPVLGAIPYIPRRLRQEEMTVRPGVQRNPLSDVAEAHRMIRASISFGLPRGSARTILVTSAASKEGKSTVSSGLAWAMSEAGERVLLIEDVVTSGGAAIAALQALRGAGATVKGILAVIDREDGGAERLAAADVPFLALFTRTELGLGGS